MLKFHSARLQTITYLPTEFQAGSFNTLDFYKETDGTTDGPTDGPTDRRTDAPSYRDARTHLKVKFLEKMISVSRTAIPSIDLARDKVRAKFEESKDRTG